MIGIESIDVRLRWRVLRDGGLLQLNGNTCLPLMLKGGNSVILPN